MWSKHWHAVCIMMSHHSGSGIKFSLWQSGLPGIQVIIIKISNHFLPFMKGVNAALKKTNAEILKSSKTSEGNLDKSHHMI